jgi:hypothetical protein
MASFALRRGAAGFGASLGASRTFVGTCDFVERRERARRPGSEANIVNTL